MPSYDYLIVGSGLFCATFAYRARRAGKRCLVIDKLGIIPVIITGRESQIVARRAEELRIQECHQGIGDKLAKLCEVAERHGVQMEEIAYIGDDYNDVSCMEACGFTGCPQNAEEDIKPKVDYVCQARCGEGAVREFVKKIKMLK